MLPRMDHQDDGVLQTALKDFDVRLKDIERRVRERWLAWVVLAGAIIAGLLVHTLSTQPEVSAICYCPPSSERAVIEPYVATAGAHILCDCQPSIHK